MTNEAQDLRFLKNQNFNQNPSRYPDFSLAECKEVAAFHKSFPDYSATPLHNLSELAEHLQVNKLWVKDEGKRFGLKAFKVLGSSYAVAKWTLNKLRRNRLRYGNYAEEKDVTYDRLLWLLSENDKPSTLCTATDGNHGYGVAWLAKRFGCKAVIYVPRSTPESRIKRIEDLGAQVFVLDKPYDEVVHLAFQEANRNGWFFIQDTIFGAYEDHAIHIMQGYLTIMAEVYEQIKNPEDRPTHIFVQAGVGSLAAALQAYLCNRFGADKPKLIVVEPRGADCFYKSFAENDGHFHSTDGSEATVMSGLNCATPNRLAWRILRDNSYGFLSCKDKVTYQGMRVLHQPKGRDRKINSGESGAVGLGAIYKICREKNFEQMKQDLGIDEHSNILVISTESDIDKDGFQLGLWEDLS